MKNRKKTSTKREAISLHAAIEMFIKISPEFLVRWERAKKFFKKQAPCMVFIVFPSDMADALSKTSKFEFRRIMDLTERLLCEGDDEVQTVLYTFFIESILSVSDKFPDVMAPVLRSMGTRSRRHALAWNEFNRTKNSGLDK